MKKKIFIAILAVIVVAFLSGCIIFRDEIGKIRHHIYPINNKYEEKNTDNDTEKTTKKKEKKNKINKRRKNRKKIRGITKNEKKCVK